MRDRSVCRAACRLGLALLASGVPAGAAAQGAREAVIYGSVAHTFAAPLWRLDRQAVPVPQPGPLAFDTFRLRRELQAGLSGFAGVALSVGRHLALGGELAYVSTTILTHCGVLLPLLPDPLGQNLQACNSLNGQRSRSSAITALGVLTARALPTRRPGPFVRIGFGGAVLDKSYVDAAAIVSGTTCGGCVRKVLEEKARRYFGWAGLLAAGVSFGGEEGQFRLEVRDVLLALPAVTGPADALAEHPVPSTRLRLAHRAMLAFGIDVVLGGTRLRRY